MTKKKGSNKKHVTISIIVYALMLLVEMGFSFWISEMAFWNSRMDLAEQYIATQADEVVERIETSVRYGKNLSNYHGINNELSDITEIGPDAIGAVVMNMEGTVTAHLLLPMR